MLAINPANVIHTETRPSICKVRPHFHWNQCPIHPVWCSGKTEGNLLASLIAYKDPYRPNATPVYFHLPARP